MKVGEKAALGFGSDGIRPLVSMATDSSQKVIMGEKCLSLSLAVFLCIPLILAGINVWIISSPVQSTGRAIVVTLASAFALALPLPFPSRHF